MLVRNYDNGTWAEPDLLAGPYVVKCHTVVSLVFAGFELFTVSGSVAKRKYLFAIYHLESLLPAEKAVPDYQP